MRHSLWILNSGLLLFVAMAVLFIAFSRQQLPERIVIETRVPAKTAQKGVPIVDVAKIYKDDLFETYQKPAPVEPVVADFKSFPQPPPQRKPTPPPAPKPVFLEPLNIELKGIISLVDDDDGNRAVIVYKANQQEKIYKVQDSFEDAHLVKIMSNKVIFLRSNGQQEVLFVRPQDAQKDPLFGATQEWDSVVQKIGDDLFNVYSKAFVQRIPSLARLIDLLDLTTLYAKGKSVCVRVGIGGDPLLRTALDLQIDDRIMEINGISTASAADRLAIYKKVTTLPQGSAVELTITRASKTIKQRYMLKDIETLHLPPDESESGATIGISPQEIKAEKVDILKKKKKFAPTTHDLLEHEQFMMLEHALKAPVSKNAVSHPTE